MLFYNTPRIQIVGGLKVVGRLFETKQAIRSSEGNIEQNESLPEFLVLIKSLDTNLGVFDGGRVRKLLLFEEKVTLSEIYYIYYIGSVPQN